MKRLRSLPLYKKTILAVLPAVLVVGVFGLVTFGTTPDVDAAPTQACQYTYYSEPAKVNIVGGIFASCWYTTRWGSVTAHSNVECFASCTTGGSGGGEAPNPITVCNDGIDNDNDGFTDCWDEGCNCWLGDDPF